MKKILILTYSFPPTPSPESYVGAKIIANLSKYFNIDLFTFKYSSHSLKLDNSLNKYLKSFKNLNINYEEIPFFKKKIIKLQRLPIRPDRFLILNNFMKKKIYKLDLNSYDFFFTRSQYHSIHFLGLHLKRNFPNVKWITSFSDPWSDNIFQRKIPLIHNLEKIYEKKIIKYSDLIICPNDELKKAFKKKIINFHEKFFSLPHSFDQKLLPTSIKTRTNKTTVIRFFGRLYADRNITKFLEVLEKWNSKKINFIIEFYCLHDEQLNCIQNSIFLKKFVKHRNYMSHSKVLSLMKQSDILLIFDSEQNDSIFFQSKLVDYIASKKLIFFIGNTNSYNAKVVKNNNGIACKNNIQDIKNNFKNALLQCKTFKPNRIELKKYNVNFVAKKLKDLIHNI